MVSRNSRTRSSDEGSALILVLVLMVVGSLLVLPLMSYAMAVGRANTVLSTKSKRTEAVKAGLRIAMASPTRLYETCGLAGATVPKVLSTFGLDVPVTTKCYFVGSAFSLDSAQVRYGAAAVQKGQSVPAGLLSTGYVSPDPTSTNRWIADTALKSVTDKIWLPDLPVHGLSPRSPLGWVMPAGFPACKVYFPGTYTNPVTINGPTFFASGIYYFEDTLTFAGGADAVVGGGVVEGCTNDQNAAFYAVNAPSTHNINGLGSTFVFGKAGRLVVSNATGTAIKLQFNKRYVAELDPGAAPSADVSIVSVNGKLGTDGITGENLLIPNVLEVPLSHVGEVTAPALPVSATTQKYLPSTLVPPPAPTVPDRADDARHDRISHLGAGGLGRTGEQRRFADHGLHGPGRVADRQHGDVRDRQRDDVRGTRVATGHQLHIHRRGHQRRRDLSTVSALGGNPDDPHAGSDMDSGAAAGSFAAVRAHRRVQPADHHGGHGGHSGLRVDPARPVAAVQPEQPGRHDERRSARGVVRDHRHPCARSDRADEPSGPAHVQNRHRHEHRIAPHEVQRDRPGQPGRRVGDQHLGSTGLLDGRCPDHAGASRSPARSWAA